MEKEPQPKRLVPMTGVLEHFLNIYTRKAVYHWVAEGCPVIKRKGKLWFNLREVEQWLVERSIR